MSSASSLNIHLATYFGDLRENKSTVFNLPVQSVHIDFTRGGETVADVLSSFPADKKLSLGLVNGRNIWINNYDQSFDQINQAVDKLGAQ